uniref:Uncharacterized protein n=1 Tax=Guillardia theta TaxID=55529 RepID=A0A7S4JKJ7_GUITH
MSSFPTLAQALQADFHAALLSKVILLLPLHQPFCTGSSPILHASCAPPSLQVCTLVHLRFSSCDTCAPPPLALRMQCGRTPPTVHLCCSSTCAAASPHHRRACAAPPALALQQHSCSTCAVLL